MKKTILAVFALLAFAAPALAWDDPDRVYRARGDSITPEAGNAVARNIAIQTIDPWPPHVRNSRINIDGAYATHGIDRYRAGKATPPRGINTQSVAPSGSGAPR